MAAINRILNNTATLRDRRTVARRLPALSRRQLKLLHEAAAGTKVFGRKAEIVDATREALLAD